MAKRKLTATQKLRQLVQQQIRRMEKRGYRVDSALKEKVKTGKYQTLKSIQKNKYRKLYESSTAESEGKVISGSRKRLIERQESAEKAVRTRQRKVKAAPDVVWKEAPSREELEDQLYDKSVGRMSEQEFDEYIRTQKDARDFMTASDIQEGKIIIGNVSELIERFRMRDGSSILEDALASEIRKYGRNAVAEALANVPGDVVGEAQNIIFYTGDKEANHKALVHFFDAIVGEVRTTAADKALGENLDRMTDFYVP